jgi:shikimate dehydrogenase
MKRACVIGWPIAHSRSPLIHNYWLKTYAIDGAYTKEAVRPEDVATFLESLAERGLVGCNVTVPHKEAAFAAADETDASARAVGAANTLWLAGGKLCATNTDTYGYMTSLGLAAPGWERRDAPVCILGAGGAARAIVHGFLEAGVGEVRVFNRTRARAEALAQQLGPRVTVCDWAERTSRARDAAVLVNTTSIGLGGAGALDIDLSRFNADCVVSDIVYVPLETQLLAQARARGLRTVDGLGMLLHQAVPGFERWFGVHPEVTRELRDLLVADIAGAKAC